MNPNTAREQGKDWRYRLRNSRLGTIGVLVGTIILVMVGTYLIDRPSASEPEVVPITLSGPSKGAPPKIGTAAQDFTATTVNGEKISLSSYKGRPVWLTFGATWCAACQAEAPDIEATYQKSKAAGVIVLAVFISEDSETVRDYSERIGLTFVKVADPDTQIASAYRVLGIPVHFFIDRTGVVRSVIIGTMTPENMESELAKVSK